MSASQTTFDEIDLAQIEIQLTQSITNVKVHAIKYAGTPQTCPRSIFELLRNFDGSFCPKKIKNSQNFYCVHVLKYRLYIVFIWSQVQLLRLKVILTLAHLGELYISDYKSYSSICTQNNYRSFIQKLKLICLSIFNIIWLTPGDRPIIYNLLF